MVLYVKNDSVACRKFFKVTLSVSSVITKW